VERAALIQLPFPSTATGHAALAAYYESYAERYREDIPDYFVPEGDLWELPLWVAHLSGILRAVGWDDTFIDLSTAPMSAKACVDAVIDATRPDDWLFFSPLAQNFGLALKVSRALRQRARRTVLGGNMSALATGNDATRVIRGVVTPETLVATLKGHETLSELRAGRRGVIGWAPRYDLLTGLAKRVPLLRLNASHGCLYACSFCGDSWSRKLHVVEREPLAAEVDRLAELFPQTNLIYVGDKTFGQSPEAVRNLRDVFATRPGYRFIIQTHVRLVDEALVETMLQLGVAVVELGFETADEQLLRELGKANGGERRVRDALALLRDAHLRVVLNVLGGLPTERPESHAKTVSFIEESSDLVWLYNLYNFVPYPLTPLFPRLRERIFDWNYENWREDAPPVFEPFHLSPQRSWELFLEKVTCAHRAVRDLCRT
jgi:hypothetical protein